MTTVRPKLSVSQKMLQDSNNAPKEMLLVSGLPTDLVVNILVRLPASSLVRLRVVCKAWCDLIDSSNFIQMHVQKHMSKGNENLITFGMHSSEYIPKLSLLKMHGYDGKSAAKIGMAIDIPLPFSASPFDKLIVESSCNGLLSLTIESMPWIILWNPATGKSRFVDLPCSNLFSSVGISFNHDTKDYKVVRILPLETQNSSESKLKISPVWIYSLNCDSWKKIDFTFPHGPLQQGSSIIFNGFLHWTTNSYEGFKIASFDAKTEVFNYLALPRTLVHLRSPMRLTLATIKGHLSVIAFGETPQQPDFSYEVWTMNEYGIEDSWKKLYTLRPFSMLAFPVGSWQDDKLLFTYTRGNDMEIFSYDLFTNMIRIFPRSKCVSLGVICYVETLESVMANKEEILKKGTQMKSKSSLIGTSHADH